MCIHEDDGETSGPCQDDSNSSHAVVGVIVAFKYTCVMLLSAVFTSNYLGPLSVRSFPAGSCLFPDSQEMCHIWGML